MRARWSSRSGSVQDVNQTFRDKKTQCHVTQGRPHLRQLGMQCDNNKDNSGTRRNSGLPWPEDRGRSGAALLD